MNKDIDLHPFINIRPGRSQDFDNSCCSSVAFTTNVGIFKKKLLACLCHSLNIVLLNGGVKEHGISHKTNGMFCPSRTLTKTFTIALPFLANLIKGNNINLNEKLYDLYLSPSSKMGLSKSVHPIF